jgi:hypothetical protein
VQPLTHGPVPGGTRFAPQVGSQVSVIGATTSARPSGTGTDGDCEQNTRIGGWPSTQDGTFQAVSLTWSWLFGLMFVHAGALARKKATIAVASGSAFGTSKQPPQVELAPPSTAPSIAN